MELEYVSRLPFSAKASGALTAFESFTTFSFSPSRLGLFPFLPFAEFASLEDGLVLGSLLFRSLQR